MWWLAKKVGQKAVVVSATTLTGFATRRFLEGAAFVDVTKGGRWRR
jgi:hypothetical protein